MCQNQPLSGTYATVVHLICLVCYGQEIYTLDPLEIYARLSEDFSAQMPEQLENKLQAIREAGVKLTQVDDETDYAIAS